MVKKYDCSYNTIHQRMVCIRMGWGVNLLQSVKLVSELVLKYSVARLNMLIFDFKGSEG